MKTGAGEGRVLHISYSQPILFCAMDASYSHSSINRPASESIYAEKGRKTLCQYSIEINYNYKYVIII